VKTRNPFRLRFFWLLLGALAVMVLVPYGWGPVYSFPEPRVFSGDHFFNPYAAPPGAWQRANFHAHGRAWYGITNGRQSDHEVVTRYRELGYSVPGVSDYQHIAAQHGVQTFPVYEHGYNIGKHHQLAIGARAVDWFDFPLWQSTSHQQFVIDRVKRKTDLVALAHPGARGAYSTEELQQLTGYDLIEVVNGPFVADDAWDAALSTAHAVWGVADDDTHDLTDPHRTAVGWNMIDAASGSTSDIVAALKAGRSYAVSRTGALDAAHVTTLSGVRVTNGRMTVTCAGAPATFSFIGQNGAIRRTVKDVTSASYTFAPGDTYIRTVIESPQTVLYLNPVIRYDGVSIASPPATVDAAGTWLLRGSSTLAAAALVITLARRRRPVLQTAARPILADIKRNTA
jgi:hypothetical protein